MITMASGAEIFPKGFEWDLNKNSSNKLKHGISFGIAALIFLDVTIEKSVIHESGEERIIAIGKIKGKFITVIYTIRSDRKRIISARKSRTNEVKDYEQRHG
jgi:hypothetical protein